MTGILIPLPPHVTKEIISERKRAYTLALGGKLVPHHEFVLADLSRFCREKRSCFDADPRIHAVLEGRREVILRIRDYIDLSEEELYKKYGGVPL